MLTRSLLLVLAVAFVATGCYHATIDTGLRASSEVIDIPWASCWVYGLVPPDVVSAQAKCQHGVAKVETQHSFLNSLVGGITFGIYTPMSIKVTCASGGSMGMLDGQSPDLVVEENASAADVQVTFFKAAEKAYQSGETVYVVY